MQTDVYIKIINEKMNMEFWMAGFLVIPKVYAVIASPFNTFFKFFSGMQFPPCLSLFALTIFQKYSSLLA